MQCWFSFHKNFISIYLTIEIFFKHLLLQRHSSHFIKVYFEFEYELKLIFGIKTLRLNSHAIFKMTILIKDFIRTRHVSDRLKLFLNFP